jgi:DNA-binding NarL/FixJ family response regulator
MRKIKILITDDHAVVRKGLKMLLEDEPNIEIVGEAIDGIDALEKIAVLMPNIIILDLTMPNMNGIEASKHISANYPTVKIVVFSMHNDTDYILKSVENGASGYLMKDSNKEEIMKAILAVMDSKKYFPPDISSLIIDDLIKRTRGTNYIENSTTTTTDGIYLQITKKEKEILNYIIKGQSSRQIAENMKLSIRTVDNHRANMMKKTKAKNTADLVNLARGR